MDDGRSSHERRCEYEGCAELKGESGVYFVIPASVILDEEMGDKRATVFSFFSIRRGIDNRVSFSLGGMARWTGRNPDRHKNAINDRLLESIVAMEDRGLLDIDGRPKGSAHVDAFFDVYKALEECDSERFAVMYVDEVRKIIEHAAEMYAGTAMNCDVLLLVFAYLRMSIYRRKNALSPGELNVDGEDDWKSDVDARRKRAPEAFNAYYSDIAEDIGMQPRAVSKAVEILNELGLIHSEPLPRIKAGDKWVTSHTLFCNAYKREGRMLLDEGEGYWAREIENKKRKLNGLKNKNR